MLTVMLLAMANPADYGLGPEWQPVADLRADFAGGRTECDTPDYVAKTCEGMAWYQLADDGTFQSDAVIAINNKPPLSIVMSAKMFVDDDQLCGRFEQENFDNMALMLGKDIYDKPEGRELLTQFRAGMADQLKGKLICSRYFANGDKRVSVATVDGVRSPDSSGESVWLTDEDEFHLRTAEPLVPEKP